MDKMAIIRSLRHASSDHNVGSHWVMTGFQSSPREQQKNERPSVGSIVAKMREAEPRRASRLMSPSRTRRRSRVAAYLGPGFNPFSLNGDPSMNNAKVRNLDPAGGLSLERLDDRRYLLSKLDRINRRRDASGTMEGLDKFTGQAYEMVTGPSARKALDLSGEDPRLRDRYGGSGNRLGQCCLLPRRHSSRRG